MSTSGCAGVAARLAEGRVSPVAVGASSRSVGQMPGVDAWCALADEVAARHDDALLAGTRDALVALGLTDPDRRELAAVVAGRQDPAGQLLQALVAKARAVSLTTAPAVSGAEPAQMDAALALSQQILTGPPETMPQRLRAAAREVLANLPPDAAGSFVSGLVAAALSMSPPTRSDALTAVLDASRSVTLGRLPVASMLTHAASAELSEPEEALVARVLAGAPATRLLSGVLDALRGGSEPDVVLRLLRSAAGEVAAAAPATPHPADREVDSYAGPGQGGRQPVTWRGGTTELRRRAGQLVVAPVAAPGDPRFALIDIDAHREVRPEVVVIDEPFDVTVGLSRFVDPDLVQAGPMTFAAGATTTLELVLVYDPRSLEPQGTTRLTLSVSDASPYPAATVSFVARYQPDLSDQRRIGVNYLVDGQVVGIAWRTVVVVTSAREVADAPRPAIEPNPIMDLAPILGTDEPDVVLSVCASDGTSTQECVWTALTAAADVTIPDLPRSTTLASDPQALVNEMRQVVSQSVDAYADFLSLTGKARRIGDAVPESIKAVLRGVIEDPDRTAPPAVLLLAEEVVLPWELAVFDPPLSSTWGGISPFLGAHAAISRWPLTQHQPRPAPRPAVAVKRAAVLTADYSGVMGWNALAHTQDEAAYVTGLFAPPVVPVSPTLRDVVEVLSGNPPADLIHVALHGQFDAGGDEGGLVLLATDAAGRLTTTPLFLTPDQLLNGRLDDGPFVFLNACQVGSDKRVLSDNGGFASTLLQIGAAGVVAPLWNVNDETAAAFAREFYAATWPSGPDGEPVSAAEAVRAQRARYTQRAAGAQTPGVDATLIAFQVFGHPRLRLHRS